MQPRVKPADELIQYTLDEQINNLGLDVIQGSLLDIGCGPNATLVNYLREQNFEAYGIDHHIKSQKPYLIRGDLSDLDLDKKFETITIHCAQCFYLPLNILTKPSGYANAPKYIRKENKKIEAKVLIQLNKDLMKLINQLSVNGQIHIYPSLELCQPHIHPILKKQKLAHEVSLVQNLSPPLRAAAQNNQFMKKRSIISHK